MRSLFKRLFLLFLATLAAAGAFFYEPSGIPVLNYHQINDRDKNALTVTSSQFAAQMDYLKAAGYHTITATELADALERGAPLPPKPVLLTFDDGYLDNYTVAYPILKERGMKAAIFLITDYVGRYPNYLTWEQAQEMQQNGIEFGSHTLNHVDLTQCASAAEVRRQLVNSKSALEWRLDRPIEFLAYPCGQRNEMIIAQLKDTGYRAAFTVELGFDFLGDNPYELHRIPIFGGNSHTLFRFKARLACPKLAATLEHWKSAVLAAGYPRLARKIPIL